METLGNKIKNTRDMIGSTQVQLSIKMGVTKNLILLWENDSRRLGYQEISKLANIFGVTNDYLTGRTTVPMGYVVSMVQIMQNKVTVYGRFSAGTPFEAIEEVLEEIEIPNRLAKKQKDLFGLKTVTKV